MVRGDEGGWCADRGEGAGLWDGMGVVYFYGGSES